MKQAPAPVARSVLIAYSLPAFVVALPTIPVFIHLPTLYGVTLGLGLAATGYALLIARIFDTVTDPLIGWLSDRFGWKGNRRKPWIAAGAVIAGIGLLQILSPPAVVDSGYLLVWSLVLYAGWTMLAVPYMAWGAELSGGYDERTRITSWRETFALLGIVGAGAVTAVTAGLGWTETESTATIAWLAIGLGGVTVPWLLWVVPDGDLAGQRKPAKRQHTLTTVKALIANRPFLRLLSAWFLNGLANGVPAALFFLYLEFGLGAAADQRPLFVLLYFIAAIAAIPLWLKLSRLYGKHRIWCWAMILACTAFVAVPVIPSGTLIAFAIVCLITGMALGADLALPPAIQADVVDYGAFRSGRARAGLQFALWGMSTKLALAAAVGLALPGVEALGFDPASPTQAGINSLVVIYALVPVVIKVLAITVVWRFPLTPEKHAIIRRRLERRAGGYGKPMEVSP